MATYTVQCLFAGWWSNEVTVEADSVDAACAKAIEEAGQDDGWRSLDDCGDTFVARICEGAHDALYSPEAEAAVLPVPYEHSERATGDIRNARELATILAALRFWRDSAEGGYTREQQEIASAYDALLPCFQPDNADEPDEITALCERLAREA